MCSSGENSSKNTTHNNYFPSCPLEFFIRIQASVLFADMITSWGNSLSEENHAVRKGLTPHCIPEFSLLLKNKWIFAHFFFQNFSSVPLLWRAPLLWYGYKKYVFLRNVFLISTNLAIQSLNCKIKLICSSTRLV